MDTFEEPENPFDTGDDRNLSSQASSSTKLNVSQPSSPPQTGDYPLPTPSYGPFPQQQKSDHWLQSSEDVEILVRLSSHSALDKSVLTITVDRRRSEDVRGFQFSLHHLCYQSGRMCPFHPPLHSEHPLSLMIRTESRSSSSLFRVRVPPNSPRQALSHSHHPPDTCKEHDRGLRGQAKQSQGGCRTDRPTKENASDVPKSHRPSPHPV